MASNVRKLRAQLRDFALALPEATEAMPWGERVAKVNKKVFVFLGRDMDTHFGFSVKLLASHEAALALPFTEPTGYGLGKSGWVSAKLEPSATITFAQLRSWVLESYRAVAPKTLAARVSGDPPVSARPARKSKTKTTTKPRAKKTAKSAPAARGKSKSVARGTRAGKRSAKA
ncbi:MAG TPA: MmcQ/YjbR family DNA-binding protein [Polyangiaceae bacterium]|jgi:predicted DNA-binding protein (MmcQ/YjbR family)|nr:MmcQ/YjbR family DNA-binding protein [Polyangiaceae bacterium]